MTAADGTTPAGAQTQVPAQTRAPARRGHVLLVEDDTSLRTILAMNLADAGFTVTEAADGIAGLSAYDAARAADAPFDVVLTDVRMPHMDGMAFLAAVRTRDAGAVVVVLTAFGGTAPALEAMRSGAFHYVEKPVNTTALLATLDRAVAHRRAAAQPGPGATHTAEPMVATSPAMNAVLKTVDKIARAGASVLIHGESGVGKELVARALHDRSGRTGAFVAVNCAAIPPDLLESELFGHEKGAFTGANKRKDGKFHAADGGTLFLDEVAEMDDRLQSKLLRVLQERRIERVGSTSPTPVDVRVVAATHQDLAARIADGRFRADLFYRLHVVPLTVPPLRARTEDIPVLFRHFVRTLAPGQTLTITPAVDDALIAHPWPGNVRELRNITERMLLLRETDTLTAADVPAELRPARETVQETTQTGAPDSECLGSDGAALHGVRLPDAGFDLLAHERALIDAALAKHGGNRSATARYLGIPRHVLVYKLDKR